MNCRLPNKQLLLGLVSCSVSSCLIDSGVYFKDGNNSAASFPAPELAKPSVAATTGKTSIVEKWGEWEANATPYGGHEVLNKIREAKGNGSHFINLEASGITDVAPLTGWTEMGTLSLSGNQITDVTPLAKLKNLGKLNLSGNPVSKARVGELRKSLPECDIEF